MTSRREFVTIVTIRQSFSAHFGGLEVGVEKDKYKKMNKLTYHHIYIIIYIYPIPTPRKPRFLFIFMQKLCVLPTDLPAKALDVFSPSARRAARSVRKMRCHLSQLSQNWFSGVSFSFGDNLVHSFSRIENPPERASFFRKRQICGNGCFANHVCHFTNGKRKKV